MAERRALGPSAWILGATGLVIGGVAAFLVSQGNPGNMGLCIACFMRDTMGFFGGEALKMNGFAYIRPELVGIVIGATVAAFATKEFRSRGGASLVTRFVLGFVFMLSALIFLGCTVRAWLRLGGGDLNALIGVLGIVTGVALGAFVLKRGYNLGRSRKLAPAFAWIAPVVALVLLALALVTFYGTVAPGPFSTVSKGAKKTAEGAVFTSEKVVAPAGATLESGAIVGPDGVVVSDAASVEAAKGIPGGSRAPLYLSLIAGLGIGALAQRSRFCSIGGIRDSILIKRYDLLIGVLGLLIGAFVVNLVLGQFNLGFEGQPAAHTDLLGNYVSMTIAGFAAVLMGGCPFRQVIMSAEGDSAAGVSVLGMAAGAFAAHGLNVASSGAGLTNVAWPAMAVMAAVVVGIAFFKRETI